MQTTRSLEAPHMGTLIKLIIALFVSPIAMLFHVGLTKHFFINIVLWLLGWFPGLIHAFVVILMTDD